jgi:hypothetical protein
MPNTNDCVNEVSAAGGGLSRAEAQAVMQQIMDQADREGIDPVAAARSYGDMIEAARVIEQRNQLGNLRKRIAMSSNVEARIDTYRAKYGDQGLSMAIRAEVRSFNTTAERSRFSAEAQARALGNKYLGGAMRDLSNAGGLLKAMYNKSFSRQVGKEMYELSQKAAGSKDANPGVTGSKEALQAATIMHGYQELAKQNLNKAGAWIGYYAGYITKTQHDGLKMWKLGKDAWMDFITPKLDPKTFDGIDDSRAWLGHVYDALVTNVHVSEEGLIGMKDPAFKGASNLAKKLSQSRELHFKDADSWLDYQEAMGSGALHDQMFKALERSGKDEALMSRFGTNPRAEYEALIQRMEEKYLGVDNGGVRHLREKQATLMNEFGTLDGTAAKPANQLGASITQGIRNIMSMAHLGNVAWTHLASMAIKVATLKSQGVGALEGWSNVLSSLVQGAHGRGHDMHSLYDLLLAGFDGQHAHYLGRFTADDGVAGSMSKATSLFMKINGLDYVLSAQKAGAQAVMARLLGRQIGKDFDNLLPETRTAFTEYGITPQEWDGLRGVQDHLQIGDRKFVTPDAALRAGLEPKAADDLANKLATYYQDIANRAIVTPGVAEKAMLGMSAAPGTIGGEALRLVMQFKTWPIAATRQVLGTVARSGDRAWGSRAVSMASLAASATVLGYLRMTLADSLKGLKPKDPRNPNTIAAAMAQGGGMGILGDVLFSQGMPDQSALASTIVGPTVGAFGQAYYAWQQVLAASNTDSNVKGHLARSLGAELTKTVINNTPFVNLWYTRTALDYLFIWHLQEMMNPGYQRRYEQRLKKQGQTFWLSPANAVR